MKTDMEQEEKDMTEQTVDTSAQTVEEPQLLQNAKIIFATFEHRVAPCVEIPHSLILHNVGKTLSLHASHIEDIGFIDNVG